MCEKNIILPFPLPSASTWKKKPCWSGGVEVKPNNGEVGRGDTRASLGLLGKLCVQPPILVSWSFRKVSPTYQWLSTGMEKLTISEWKFCSCEKQNEAQVLHVPDVFSERFLKKEGECWLSMRSFPVWQWWATKIFSVFVIEDLNFGRRLFRKQILGDKKWVSVVGRQSQGECQVIKGEWWVALVSM